MQFTNLCIQADSLLQEKVTKAATEKGVGQTEGVSLRTRQDSDSGTVGFHFIRNDNGVQHLHVPDLEQLGDWSVGSQIQNLKVQHFIRSLQHLH